MAGFLLSTLSSMIASLIFEGSKSVFCQIWKSKRGFDVQIRKCFENAVDKCLLDNEVESKALKQNSYEEYLAAVKARLIDEKAYDTDGGLFGDILKEFESSVTKHPLFMLRILYLYLTKIRKDTEEIKEELQSIGNSMERIHNIVKNSQLKLDALSISSTYVLPPIVVGKDRIDLPDILIKRDEVVRTLSEEIDSKGCVWLSGELYSGKTVTSELLAIDRRMDNPVVFRFSYDMLNVRSIIENVSKERLYKLLIIDGLPQYKTEQMEDICRLLREKTAQGMRFLINGRDFDHCAAVGGSDFAHVRQPMITEEELRASEPRCTETMARMIISISNGIPALVALLVIYLKNNRWALTQEELARFISIPDKEDIRKLTNIKIREILADGVDVQLLSRLSLFRKYFSEKDAVSLSAVQPCINTPKTRLDRLVSMGLIVQDDEGYRVSQLIRKLWTADLIDIELRDCTKAVVDTMINGREIDVFTATHAIILLHRAGEHDEAGLLYCTCLFKLLDDKSFDHRIASHLTLLWRDMPLPTEMSLKVKISIRLLQTQVLQKMNGHSDYALNDLNTYFGQIPVGDPLKAMVASYIAIQYTLTGHISEALLALPYIQNDAAMSKEIEEMGLMTNEINDKLPTIMLANVKNLNQLYDWFDFYAQRPAPRLEMETDAVKVVLGNVTKAEKNEDILSDIIQRTADIPAFSVFHTAAVCLLIQHYAAQKEFDRAWSLYNEHKSLEKTSLGRLWMGYVMGLYHNDKGEKDEALASFLQAFDASAIAMLPGEYALCHVAAARIHSDRNEHEKAVDILKTLVAYEDLKQWLSEEEWIRLCGELAIASWNCGQREETFRQLKNVHDYLWARRDEDSNRVKLLMIKMGICVQQYALFMDNGTYDEKRIMPFITLFYFDNDKLLCAHDARRKGTNALMMFMFAARIEASAEIGLELACEAIEGCAGMIEEKNPLCSIFNDMLPTLLEHGEMAMAEYLSRNLLALLPQIKALPVSTDYHIYVPLVMMCMKRIIDRAAGADDRRTVDIIREMLDSSKPYMQEDNDFISLGKAIETKNVYEANGLSFYPMMCAHLYLYDQLTVQAAYILMYGVVRHFEVHRFYATRFLRMFVKTFAGYLLTAHAHDFDSRYNDPTDALQKTDSTETDDHAFALKTLRLLHGFSKSQITLSVEDERYIGI